MSGSTFFDRIDQLAEEIGDGHLIAACEVDQIYAHRQHEELTWHHPAGGQAKYLEGPFLEGAEDHARRFAKGLLDTDGPRGAAAEIAEGMARDVFEHAPFEFGDLRASGHPFVIDGGDVVTADLGKTEIAGGETVYDRPPAMHRLSREELEAKGDLRELGFGNTYAGE